MVLFATLEARAMERGTTYGTSWACLSGTRWKIWKSMRFHRYPHGKMLLGGWCAMTINATYSFALH